jgi:class 3 adenylate cyclase/tetratricopeptide (TPR) repeat protein
VLFGDLSGYTQLIEQIDPEEAHDLVADCLDHLCEGISRWGGYVDKFIGDCVMALFGAPIAYENEAERAVRAALDMQRTMRAWTSARAATQGEDGYQPELRIGIATGPVVMGLFAGGGAQNYTAVGDTVNVASRLEGLCEPGRILVDSKTYEQTRHIFEFDDESVLNVKGRSQAVRARHVAAVRTELGSARGFLGKVTPLVGRKEELAALRQHWQRAVTGEFQFCLVNGPAGIGKSRLVRELIQAEGLGESQIAQGRCYPYTTVRPWEPITEMVLDLYRLPADLSPQNAVANIVHASPGEWTPEEIESLEVAFGRPVAEATQLQLYNAAERQSRINRALKRCVESTFTEPRLLVLEDLHWADSTTLEALRQLPEAGFRGPVLAVLISRDPLPGEDGLANLFEAVRDEIDIPFFSDEESRSFLDILLGAHELPEAFIDRVVERADGNPLFVEETLKSLLERQLLVQTDNVWRVEHESPLTEVPDTIESVLTARMDALDAGTKSVLQYAAVVGRRFWAGVVTDALARRAVDRELDSLIDGSFVRQQPHSAIAGDREFLFEQLLLHQVAYEGMLLSLRSELHTAVAEWLELRSAGKVADYDDWVAFHYERSKEPARAVPFLENAAKAALARGAIPDALTLVERALKLADGAVLKASLLLIAEEIAAESGDVVRRQESIAELEKLAGELSDTRIAAEADYRRSRHLLDSGDLQDARQRGELALEGFKSLDDISMQADVLRILGRIAHLSGSCPEALKFYRASLPLERAAGDRFGQAEIFDRLGLVQVDVGDFTTALDYFEAARNQFIELGYRPAEARVIGHQALALCGLGQFEEAEEVARAALRLAEDCGSIQAESGARLALAMVLLARDDKLEATQLLETVCADTRRLRQPGFEARAWSLLARTQTGADARESARRALTLAQRSGLVHVEILALTREAELALDANDLTAADTASAEATRRLYRHGNIQGPEEAVLYTRLRTLATLGRQDEMRDVLAHAQQTVKKKAELIQDVGLRRRYLDEIPLNRKILELGDGSEQETE